MHRCLVKHQSNLPSLIATVREEYITSSLLCACSLEAVLNISNPVHPLFAACSDALLDGLDNGQIGALGLDVYENEGKLFFEDWTKYDTAERMKHWDRRLSLLASYPEVLLSPHSAFLTKEALGNIGDTTMENLVAFFTGSQLANEVKLAPVPVPAGVVPARN